MQSESEIIKHLTHWANEDDNIRAMWQWGSRADPRRTPDALSDHDIGILARTKSPFASDDSWVSQFGSIMVRWPSRPSPTLSDRWLTQLVLFEDGLRIDFQITELPFRLQDIHPEPYRMLLDKDGTASAAFDGITLPIAISLPDEETFNSQIGAFWWDIVYVPKALARDELNFAKYMLDSIIRHENLEPLIRWYIGATVGRDTDVGIHGRWFKRYLPLDLWNRYLRTFAGSSIEENWKAVFTTIEFTREIATELAQRLGFKYPIRTDTLVSDYIKSIYQISNR